MSMFTEFFEEQIKALRAELAAEKERADKAEADIRIMVEKAADKSLAGYRELGARCAQLEQERDLLRAQQGKRIVELDSFCHYQIVERDGRRILLEYGDECPGMGDRNPYTEDEALPKATWAPGEEVIFVTRMIVSTGKVTDEIMCGDDFLNYHLPEDT